MRARGGREAGRDVTRRARQVVMICHAFFRGHKEKRHPVIGGVAWWLKKGVMQSIALRLLLYANFIFIILDAPNISFRTSNGNPVYPDMLD